MASALMSFERFRAHMKTTVIPEQLADTILSEEEAEQLIIAQWKDMPESERQKWIDKAQETQPKSTLASPPSVGLLLAD